MRRRRRLFWKYVSVIVALVAGALLASGLVEIYFSYGESQQALVALQHEKAEAAAARIDLFVREIERQMGWTTQPLLVAPAAALEQRRIDALRLLRQVPAITELAYLDPSGKEQIVISRLKMDVFGSGADHSRDPRFIVPRSGRTYYGPVYFRKESEPYMTLALPASGGGVMAAEVNLKFIWNVVSRIRVGRAGHAYVVDGQGTLIAHPDISLVLQKTSMAGLEQVRAALTAQGGEAATSHDVPIAHDLGGHRVLTASSTIAPLHWTVFVEQPIGEAFQPLRASITRTALLIALGVALSVVASLLLARRMVRPIRALEEGAAKIGAGELGHRIAVRTGDEVEALGEQFNRMTARLQESYATLEQKVEERTRELTDALEQQTATAEILRVISRSPTDLSPVFNSLIENALRLCHADAGILWLWEESTGLFRPGAMRGAPDAYAEFLRSLPSRADPDTGLGRIATERKTVHIADVTDDEVYRRGDPLRVATVELLGARTFLAIPMLAEGALVGTFTVYRRRVEPFTERQVALIQTFADQAVIAVANVRLFQELQARTAALGRSVDELTALGEVGRALSSTLHLETVLATIAARANHMAAADGCVIYGYDEAVEAFRLLRASDDFTPEFVEALRARPIPRGEGVMDRAAHAREPVQIPDIAASEAYGSPVRDRLVAAGYRALLAVPLLREDHVLGGLVVSRKVPGAFPSEVVNLLQTFATQSTLAIQNARLFGEIEDKSAQLEIADRHKSEFLANMSHELRTPLNAVIGFSEVLLERMFGDVNDKQEEYLQDILSSGRHLLSLINDILDLSKIEAGRMELEVTEFDLPQALDNALTLVRERAARRGLALTVDVDGRLGAFRGDERKVKQVLLNLLSNAIKFTPEGGKVELRAQAVDGQVEIAVRDTGIGIAPEDHEAVFEEFRQVGTDYARKREGTGLGLALARRFVELHGGRIGLTSAPGQGSTFTITLPVKPWPTSSS